MNFNVTIYKDGRSELSWDKSQDIGNNIYYSIHIKKGTLFNDPNFGLDLKDIKKITVNNIVLIKQRIENALKWILDLGRAKSILVKVEKDLQNINRINYSVDAVQADGIPVLTENYIEVGGAQNGFTFP